MVTTVAERETDVIAEAAIQRDCVPALVTALVRARIRSHGLAAVELVVHNRARLDTRNLDAAGDFLSR